MIKLIIFGRQFDQPLIKRNYKLEFTYQRNKFIYLYVTTVMGRQ